MTYVTWVLIVYLSGYKAGGPVKIEDISSEANCRAVAARIQYDMGDRWGGYSCVGVRKIKP